MNFVEISGVKLGPVALQAVRDDPEVRELFGRITAFDLSLDYSRRIRTRVGWALSNYDGVVGRAFAGVHPAVEAFFASCRGTVVTKRRAGFTPYVAGQDDPLEYADTLVAAGELTTEELADAAILDPDEAEQMLASPEHAGPTLRRRVRDLLVSRGYHRSEMARQRVDARRHCSEAQAVKAAERTTLLQKLQQLLHELENAPPRYRRLIRSLGMTGGRRGRKGRSGHGPKEPSSVKGGTSL